MLAVGIWLGTGGYVLLYHGLKLWQGVSDTIPSELGWTKPTTTTGK